VPDEQSVFATTLSCCERLPDSVADESTGPIKASAGTTQTRYKVEWDNEKNAWCAMIWQ
jgi:hypothetical protein